MRSTDRHGQRLCPSVSGPWAEQWNSLFPRGLTNQRHVPRAASGAAGSTAMARADHLRWVLAFPCVPREPLGLQWEPGCGAGGTDPDTLPLPKNPHFSLYSFFQMNPLRAASTFYSSVPCCSRFPKCLLLPDPAALIPPRYHLGVLRVLKSPCCGLKKSRAWLQKNLGPQCHPPFSKWIFLQ